VSSFFWLTRTRSACETGHIVRGRATLERALTLTGAVRPRSGNPSLHMERPRDLAQIARLYDSSRSLRVAACVAVAARRERRLASSPSAPILPS
jgi:hypothetical protein